MAFGAIGALSAVGAPIWASFTNFTTGAATGTLGGVNVTVTSNNNSILLPGTSSTSSSLWSCALCGPAYLNSGLANSSLIAVQNAATYTVTFGGPISSPIYFGYVSLGSNSSTSPTPVTVKLTYSGISNAALQAGGVGSFGGSAVVVNNGRYESTLHMLGFGMTVHFDEGKRQ